MDLFNNLGAYLINELGTIPEAAADWVEGKHGGQQIVWACSRDGYGWQLAVDLGEQTMRAELDLGCAARKAGGRHGLSIDISGEQMVVRESVFETVHADEMADEIRTFAAHFTRDVRAMLAEIATAAREVTP